jgi:hypothetical protein
MTRDAQTSPSSRLKILAFNRSESKLALSVPPVRHLMTVANASQNVRWRHPAAGSVDESGASTEIVGYPGVLCTKTSREE